MDKAKLLEWLHKKSDEYESKGFRDYSDVEKLAGLGSKIGDKEIDRCQFLLEMIEKLEKKIEEDFFDNGVDPDRY